MNQSTFDYNNNLMFNSTKLPVKLKKFYRYDTKCPIQSAWISYYDHKRKVN